MIHIQTGFVAQLRSAESTFLKAEVRYPPPEPKFLRFFPISIFVKFFLWSNQDEILILEILGPILADSVLIKLFGAFLLFKPKPKNFFFVFRFAR